MSAINRKKMIHETFIAGVILKGVSALLEIFSAVALFFLTPNGLARAVSAVTAGELMEDPQDIIANALVRYASTFSANARVFILFYLLSHGLIKVCLLAALVKRYLWAYPLAMSIFGIFGAYQLYRYTHTHSSWLVVLTVFDALIIILTWLEYKNLKAAEYDKN